jgi:hypothetical protein
MTKDAMPKRPWTVTTASYMLWLSILWLPAVAILWGLPNGVPPNWKCLEGVNGVLLLGLVGLVLACWLTLALVVSMVGRGRNWARIIVLILLLLGAPRDLLDIIQSSGHSPFPGPLYKLFQIEILLVAVVLLFQRSSSRWFRAMKKLRSKDEAPAAI